MGFPLRRICEDSSRRRIIALLTIQDSYIEGGRYGPGCAWSNIDVG